MLERVMYHYIKLQCKGTTT